MVAGTAAESAQSSACFLPLCAVGCTIITYTVCSKLCCFIIHISYNQALQLGKHCCCLQHASIIYQHLSFPTNPTTQNTHITKGNRKDDDTPTVQHSFQRGTRVLDPPPHRPLPNPSNSIAPAYCPPRSHVPTTAK